MNSGDLHVAVKAANGGPDGDHGLVVMPDGGLENAIRVGQVASPVGPRGVRFILTIGSG